MRFQHYDNLRVFAVVAGCGSISMAADELHLTKGAVSYRMKQLEGELGFAVFVRTSRGVTLSEKGSELLSIAQGAFGNIERKIAELSHGDAHTLTIGTSTYFASRWLSPRLMDFMRQHSDIRMRMQPMVNFRDMKRDGIDLAIRWGRGDWDGVTVQKLFDCPAWPIGNRDALACVEANGMQHAMETLTLLHDKQGSLAWERWHNVAGLDHGQRADTLTIPDPNVRVQAVIDGQGIALCDDLVAREIETGDVHRLSGHQLSDYGYFLNYDEGALDDPGVAAFVSWVVGVV